MNFKSKLGYFPSDRDHLRLLIKTTWKTAFFVTFLMGSKLNLKFGWKMIVFTLKVEIANFWKR